MTMTNGEIVTSYRQAKKPKDQIGVLADLNGCTAATIVAILKKEGAIPVGNPIQTIKPEAAGKVPRFDWVKGMEMYEQGATDKEIAEAIGGTRNLVSNWRGRHRLPNNAKKVAQSAAVPKKATPPVLAVTPKVTDPTDTEPVSYDIWRVLEAVCKHLEDVMHECLNGYSANHNIDELDTAGRHLQMLVKCAEMLYGRESIPAKGISC